MFWEAEWRRERERRTAGTLDHERLLGYVLQCSTGNCTSFLRCGSSYG